MNPTTTTTITTITPTTTQEHTMNSTLTNEFDWFNRAAMLASDELVRAHEDGLSDAEFDDRLAAVLRSERVSHQAEAFILDDHLLDRAVDLEMQDLAAERAAQISENVLDDLSRLDFDDEPVQVYFPAAENTLAVQHRAELRGLAVDLASGAADELDALLLELAHHVEMNTVRQAVSV